MGSDEPAERLSQISTAWTVLFQAHADATETAQAARQRLLEQYGTPVYRYLRAATRDADAADDLYQEFALRFVRGDLQRAHPDRGRFRDFLKTCLYHLVIDHQRRQSKRLLPLPAVEPAAASESTVLPASDQEFLAAWRAELLARAWDGLERWEQEKGRPLFAVLRLRTDNPDLPAPQLAQRLAEQLGRGITAGWVRKHLHQARRQFVELLLDQLRQTLEPPEDDTLEQELIELGLLQYCRSVLRSWRPSSGQRG